MTLWNRGIGLRRLRRCHMLHGTTTILPTTVTGSREQLLEFVEMFNRVQLEREGCPHIHGLHLRSRILPLRRPARRPRMAPQPGA